MHQITDLQSLLFLKARIKTSQLMLIYNPIILQTILKLLRWILHWKKVINLQTKATKPSHFNQNVIQSGICVTLSIKSWINTCTIQIKFTYLFEGTLQVDQYTLLLNLCQLYLSSLMQQHICQEMQGRRHFYKDSIKHTRSTKIKTKGKMLIEQPSTQKTISQFLTKNTVIFIILDFLQFLVKALNGVKVRTKYWWHIGIH